MEILLKKNKYSSILDILEDKCKDGIVQKRILNRKGYPRGLKISVISQMTTLSPVTVRKYLRELIENGRVDFSKEFNCFGKPVFYYTLKKGA